jgi:hypothetical protein
MENTIQFPTDMITEYELLLLISSILLGVNRIVSGIQMMVAVLLRYAALGASITDSLIGLFTLSSSEGS